MRKRTGRNSSLLIMIVVAAIALLLLGQNYKLNRRISEGNQQMASLDEQIAEEEKRTEEIQSLEKEMQTDEYKEKAAKEKLGLIKDGEIIFREAD